MPITQSPAQIVENHNAHLVGGHLLARNIVWNLAGAGAPMIFALFCIPLLVNALGTARFGVLALAWALIGYASLFDLGLGRALTQLVARKLAAGMEDEIPSLVWTSLYLMLVFGAAGAAAMAFVSPWLVHQALNIPSSIQHDTLRSFYALGLAIPITISTTALRGLLEAYQRFTIINTLRIPIGILMFVGPILVLPFSKSLFPIVAVLVGGRLIALIAHLLLCLQVLPTLRNSISWRWAPVGSLLRFGGWLTVSNIVGPLMVTLDRFLISALVSVQAVSFYATPFEAITKFLLVPTSIMGVMFPAFSMSYVHNDQRTSLLFQRSLKYMMILLFPLILAVIVLAQDGLRLWLGAAFAQQSTRVLQWLAVGVFINSAAHLLVALIQGIGRADITAKLHVAELPVYLLVLWKMIAYRGIEGAAIVWTLRVALDTFALFILAKRLLPRGNLITCKSLLVFVLTLIILVSAALPHGLLVKGIFLSVILLAFTLSLWFFLLSPEERSFVQGKPLAIVSRPSNWC